MNEHQSLFHGSNSSMAQAQPPQKKRRNQPGTPNPDAEVIALSPKSLMATNRFMCEVCGKGFQREQNLQLHRRGHNLPWKLKQKNTKEGVKRKVYLCPEPTCVHHDPSRALGDLTGIKKHFFRKHGEKKFKCEKCSKKYAVQSDWKAHSKTCGTREYKCDCGTLFSRRDSFITHRAFCDALAQESAKHPPSLSTIGTHLYGNNNNILGFSKLGSTISSDHHQNHSNSSTDLLRLSHDHQLNIGSSSGVFRPNSHTTNMPSTSLFLDESPDDFATNKTPLWNIPNQFNLNFFQNNGSTSGGDNNIMANFDNISTCSVPSLYGSQVDHKGTEPVMSATALLQKAALMGSSSTTTNSFNASSFFGNNSSDHRQSGFGTTQDHQQYGVGGYNKLINFDQKTRDFLGVGEIVRSSILDQQQHNGMLSSLDSDSNQSQQHPFASPPNFQ